MKPVPRRLTAVLTLVFLLGAAPAGAVEFWGISSAAALAGMLTTFPVQYWMAARGRVALPGFRIVEAKTVRRTEIAAMAAGSLGLLAAGLLVVGAF